MLRRVPPVKTRAAVALVEFTIRRVFSGKRISATLLLLMVAPAVAGALAALGASRPGVAPFFDQLTFHLSLHITLVLTAMVYGVALTSSEIEDGTAGYLFLTACPRWQVALAHVLVVSPILAILTGASIALTYAAATLSPAGAPMAGPVVILADTLIAWIALTAYLAFFVFCGYAFKRNLAISVGTMLVWEFLLPMIPTKFATLTVTLNTRVLWLYLAQQGERGRWFRHLTGVDLPNYGQASMFLSVVVALFLTLAMITAMNRSVIGREAA
ncbi:MAG: hypothetical protein HYY16_09085 [Planctomycetes bacterium]|nr:hypothetical protein [Planctomycetota bacterium]